MIFFFFCNFFSWMEKMTSNIRWLGCIKDRLNWIILCSFPQQELEKQSKEVRCCLQRTFPAQEPRMECDSFSQTRVNVASGSFILFHSFYKKEKSHRGTEGPFTSQTHRLLPGNVIKKKQKKHLLSYFPASPKYPGTTCTCFDVDLNFVTLRLNTSVFNSYTVCWWVRLMSFL